MIDVYYNSIFTNFFNCAALIPSDIRPEDTFIHQLYLTHGLKEVSPDELEYAFSELFGNEAILDKIGEIGDSTSERNRISESIFLPVKIFDGKTNYIGGNSYLEELSSFLTEQCEFMWIY